MSREIILPPHLYDRIKASAGEHGGIGRTWFFDGGPDGSQGPRVGVPHCAHAHAWGTCTRYAAAGFTMEEPELAQYLSSDENDRALYGICMWRQRIPFAQWCELLNVKRGVAPAVASVVDCELAVD